MFLAVIPFVAEGGSTEDSISRPEFVFGYSMAVEFHESTGAMICHRLSYPSTEMEAWIGPRLLLGKVNKNDIAFIAHFCPARTLLCVEVSRNQVSGILTIVLAENYDSEPWPREFIEGIVVLREYEIELPLVCDHYCYYDESDHDGFLSCPCCNEEEDEVDFLRWISSRSEKGR